GRASVGKCLDALATRSGTELLKPVCSFGAVLPARTRREVLRVVLHRLSQLRWLVGLLVAAAKSLSEREQQSRALGDSVSLAEGHDGCRILPTLIGLDPDLEQHAPVCLTIGSAREART